MNLTEFAALKAGDKISNPMTASYGEVVEVTTTTVLVRWHVGTTPRTYGANTTAWMHWDKVEVSKCISDPENCDCEEITIRPNAK